MYMADGTHFWGMHFVWWFFWVGMMVMVFGFNLPEQTRRSKNDPYSILRRRFASGELSEEDYEKMKSRLEGNNEPIRKNIVIQSSSHEFGKHPLVDGLSLSVSWGVLYTLCAIGYWISPNSIVMATSKLFHGLSFTQMAQQGTAFGLGDYFSVLTIGAIYTFIAGMLWSSVHELLLRKSSAAREEKKHVLRPNVSSKAS